MKADVHPSSRCAKLITTPETMESSVSSPVDEECDSLPPSPCIDEQFPYIVHLNVGGYHFTTSRSTLLKYDDSMLAVMFSGRHEIAKDEHGRYFIDRDGKYFRYIVNYLRSSQLPPECVALEVLREAEFFCLQILVELLEAVSPKVISLRRREHFRRLIPDYESIKTKIIGLATEKRSCFEQSKIALTQEGHPKLKGSIPCYNCTREFVSVNHFCAFEGIPSDLSLDIKKVGENLDIDRIVNFLVDELRHDGFSCNVEKIICKFSLRCQSCTLSGLYTAGGILAPRECPNVAHVITFFW